ncbi:HAD family phosphatase [Temperatibacter marinus]|uniref:HAD family phosphatase n=1 Tax=Temperatibacter marinus TaxID=1456591 RepID=A0AA52EAQ5_9PROT|nr:HAD family phosphatase [Temperatibacter marinus]WND01847.1 HAD family phosphatase [Temperatibacter marinus]
MKKISAVIFDVGNVLVKWDPRVIYEKHFEDKTELDWFMDTVVNMDWHKHHDAGRTFEEGVRIRSEKFPDYADLIKLYHTQWDDTITGVIQQSVDCLRALKAKGIPVYGLTNFNGPQFDRFRQQFDFIGLMDGVVVSGDEGIIKPDPAIYHLILERYGLKAEETYFIDDGLPNIVAARAEGIVGHHFTSPEGLVKELKDFGLI